MGDPRFGTNELVIAVRPFLLAGRDKTHLVGVAGEGEAGRSAVERDRFEAHGEWQEHYDGSALLAERWNQRTICGCHWPMMRTGEGPLISPNGESAFAPDCRSCLRIVSKRLESSPRDDRIDLVASLAAQEARERGSAMVAGVPGDQVEALRAGIRKAMRTLGLKCGTGLYNDVVHAWLEGALEPEQQAEADRLAIEVVGRIGDLSGDAPLVESRVIEWGIWG